jgi:hypothetical protein
MIWWVQALGDNSMDSKVTSRSFFGMAFQTSLKHFKKFQEKLTLGKIAIRTQHYTEKNSTL